MTTALILSACGGGDSGGDSVSVSSYRIAGNISGLNAAGLILQNGGEQLSVPANATSFQFNTGVAAGGSYSATIATQPSGLICTLSQGAGSNVQATVSTIRVVCNAQTHNIAGTITGLTADGLVLQNNGADNLTVAANATSFQFATPIAANGGYSVAVSTQPVGLTCTVSNGVGSNVGVDIHSVHIVCSARVLSIGGTITGLTGSGLVLQNNTADDLAIAANASTFEFAAPVAYGAGYAVTVLQQPAGQICSLTHDVYIATLPVVNVALTCANIVTYTVTPSSGGNGSISPSTAVVVNSGGNQGFVATPGTNYVVNQWLLDSVPVQSGGSVYTLTNITAHHTVAVTFAQTTLSSSVASLALAVNCLPSSSCTTMQNAQLTGTPRLITIANTGSLDATNVVVTPTGLPSGTTITASTCGSVLAPASSCAITITPGATASSACTTGISPTPGTVTISADDASAIATDVVVLSYGCIYQAGFIYSIDDMVINTGSIGGKIAALGDTFPGQTSPGAGTPYWGELGVDVGATLYDTDLQGSNVGAANSAAIISAFTTNYNSPPYNGSSPVPLTNYAAGLCSLYEVDSSGNTPCSTGSCYTNWHLPAICELGSSGGACASGSTNIESQLFAATPAVATLGIVNNGIYWSSTQLSANPNLAAITWIFTSGGASVASPRLKTVAQGIRCSRALTP